MSIFSIAFVLMDIICVNMSKAKVKELKVSSTRIKSSHKVWLHQSWPILLLTCCACRSIDRFMDVSQLQMDLLDFYSHALATRNLIHFDR